MKRNNGDTLFIAAVILSVFAHICAGWALVMATNAGETKPKISAYKVRLIAALPGGPEKPAAARVDEPAKKPKTEKAAHRKKPRKKEKENAINIKAKAPRRKPKPTPRPEPTKAEAPPAAEPTEAWEKVVDTFSFTRRSGGRVGGFETSARLGTGNFAFGYYVQNVRDKIIRNWNIPARLWRQSEERIATVYFKIRSDGHIAEVRMESESGVKGLDQKALNAVRFSDPFPPLPFGFQEEYLGVYFDFKIPRWFDAENEKRK